MDKKFSEQVEKRPSEKHFIKIIPNFFHSQRERERERERKRERE